MKKIFTLLAAIMMIAGSNYAWAEKGFILSQEITDDLSTLAENGTRFSIVQKGTTNHIIAACDRGSWSNQYHYQSLDAFSADWNEWSGSKQIGYQFSLEATDTPNQYYIKCYDKETNDAYYGGGYLGYVSWTTNSSTKTSDVTDHQWIVTKVANGYTIQTTKDSNKYLKGNGDDWTGANLTSSSDAEVVYQFYTIKLVDYTYSFNYGGTCNLTIDADHISTTGEVTFNPVTKQVTVGAAGGTLAVELGKFDFTKVTNIVNDFSTYEYLDKTNIYQGSNDKGLWSSSKQNLSVAVERRLNPINKIVYTLKAGTFTINSVSLKSDNYSNPEFADNGQADVNLDFIQTTGAVTYNPATKTLTSTGTGSFFIELNNMDLSHATRLDVTCSGDDIVNSSQIIRSNQTALNTWYKSKYGMDITSSDNKNEIVKLVWNIVENAGSEETPKTMTLSRIFLTSKMLDCTKAGEKALNTLQYHKIDGSNADAAYNVKKATDTYYGSGSSDASFYVDLTDYEELRIYRKEKIGFRAFFVNSGKTGTNNINDENTAVKWNEIDKYYSIDLSKIEKTDGKVYLTTIKSSAWDVNNSVESITVYNAPAVGTPKYSFSGSGVLTSAAKSALSDASATLIDVTGVTGSGVEFVSANPNCIFKANAGVLSNESNVLVDGTINNLVITDGKPFALPAETAEATAASYSRSAAGSYGTICLPYAVESDETIQYYELESADAEKVTIKKVESVAAGTPAIFKKKDAGTTELTFAGEGTLSQAVDGSESEGTVLTLKGTYEKISVTDADQLAKTYYISGDKVMNATKSLTINPFRAYIEAAAVSPAKFNLFESDDAPTVVNALFNAGKANIKAIYGVNGALQSELQEGVNIVEFTNGTTKTVIVK